MYAVWGVGADEVWAVGFGSTLLHWDGERWSRREFPPEYTRATDIWGDSPEDFWVTSSDGLYRWHDCEWEQVCAEDDGCEFSQIVGLGKEEVWFLGISEPKKWNGESLKPLKMGGVVDELESVRRVWRTSSGHEILVGSNKILHRRPDGESSVVEWDFDIADVHGSSADDVWVVSEDYDVPIRHFDGEGWQKVQPPESAVIRGVIKFVWAGDKSVWVGGTSVHVRDRGDNEWETERTQFTREIRNRPRGLHDVWGTGDGQLFGAGRSGVLARRTREGEWRRDSSGHTAEIQGFADEGDTLRWAVTRNGRLLERTEDGWKQIDPMPRGGAVTDIVETKEGNVWLVSRRQGLIEWDGEEWRMVESFPGSGEIASITVIGGEVWVGGIDGTLWRHEDDNWRKVKKFDRKVTVVAGASPSEVYVSLCESLREYDGESWSTPSKVEGRSFDCLRDIYVPEEGGSAWVSTNMRLYAKRDGEWSVREPKGGLSKGGTGVSLHGHGANDVWVRSKSGTFAHWNGESWRTVDDIALTNQVVDLFVGEQHVWSGSRKPAVLRYERGNGGK